MAVVTQGRPKELLKLGRRTVLDRIIEEAREAGADEIVVVTSPNKPEIAEALADQDVRIAIQPTMRGVADAVVRASVDDDVLVMLGDAVFLGGSPSARMAELVYKGLDGAIAVERVSEADMSLYGIVEIDDFSGGIRRILEKPKPNETPSRWAVAARYAFSRPLMAEITDAVGLAEASGEIGLTQILMQAIAGGTDLKAVALQGEQQRVDCGSPEEYSAARRLPWD